MTFARTQNPVRRILSRTVVEDTPRTASENVTLMFEVRLTPVAPGRGVRDRIVGRVLSTTVTGALIASAICASSSMPITDHR